MSGPKSGSYVVVSEEELRRRRLRAAQDRLRRLQAARQALAGEVRAAAAAYGALPVSAPAEPTLRGTDPETWERAAAALEQAMTRTRTELADALQAARVRSLVPSRKLTVTAAPDEPSSRRSRGTSAASRADEQADAQAAAELARVLGRLPADSTPTAVERCTRLAEAFSTATALRREALLGDLRLTVQRETDAARLRRANAARLEELYQQLDGVPGERVERLRGRLRGLALDEPLPADLEESVTAAVTHARAEEDRRFVLDAAATALQDLGYEVEEDFVTAVPAAGGALLDLPHSRRHAVRVREQNGQLMVNVVRLDESKAREAAADTDAEERFCGDFTRLRSALGHGGVELTMTRAEAPGTVPVQVLKPSARPAQRRGQDARLRQRPL